jgi:ATP-dependent Clp protease ATP-binding subunit ClpB
MDLGGEPEKKALEEYGVDLTERARDGKSTTQSFHGDIH